MRSSRALSELRRTLTARLSALWLVVLAAGPFTAPFAALDWSDLVGRGRTRPVGSTLGVPVASSAPDDDADDAAASDACVQRAHSLRFCELAPVLSPVAGGPPAPSVSVLSHLGPPRSARGPSARFAVLRL